MGTFAGKQSPMSLYPDKNETGNWHAFTNGKQVQGTGPLPQNN